METSSTPSDPSVDKREESAALVTTETRLLQLKEAEAQLCEILHNTSETCAVLESLPFSDVEKVKLLSDSVFRSLQSVRSNIVANIDVIQPLEVGASVIRADDNSPYEHQQENQVQQLLSLLDTSK
mmetsp:Transcript_15594/g.26127  ORF Transcript_15594/g.26127 Transcript_15594/m.26127 type:complete len:126 (+) Transcript_15594:69-446(+)